MEKCTVGTYKTINNISFVTLLYVLCKKHFLEGSGNFQRKKCEEIMSATFQLREHEIQLKWAPFENSANFQLWEHDI